jgi:signal transduction histidine kinase
MAPLNAVLGFTGLLLTDTQPALTPKQHQQLGHVQEAGLHLLVLVNDLLDPARVEAKVLM